MGLHGDVEGAGLVVHPAVFEGGLFDIGAGDQVLALLGVKDVLDPAPVAELYLLRIMVGF
jgi:hypothetical protein